MKGNVSKVRSGNVAKADAAQTLNDNLKVVIVQQDETQLASFPDFLAKLFSGKVVIIPSGENLPQTGVQMTIYFKQRSDSEVNNVYDEYMYVNNAWEKIGSTTFEAANYYTKAETNTLLAAKQKTWRKIIDKTLTAEEDDTPYIAFTKDSGNNVFSLSQVKICIYSPADDSMTSATQDAYVLLGTNTLGAQNYGKFVVKRVNKANYAVIEGFAQEEFITYVNFVACYTEIARKDNIFTCFGENPMMYEKISRIALACNTPNGQAGFRTGTRIVIWGLDK